MSRQRLENLLFYLLLAAAIALAGWLGDRYGRAWDWSDSARNSLGSASVQLLQRLDAPLEMVSFAPPDPALRQRIGDILERYRRQRPDLVRIRFVDPARQPQLTRELGIRLAGELRLGYRGRSENLRTLDEEHISNAIQRLLLRGESWIVGLTGHGERRLDGSANHDLGEFGRELERKGYRVQSLNLAESPEIPDNTGLLVIAGPQEDYLPGEVKQIRRYLEQGGNLLWLLDPGPLHGLEPIASRLGLTLLPGTIVDAEAGALGLDDPTVAVVSRYPEQAAVRRFDRITLFPGAAALRVKPGAGWQVAALLQTQARSWNETGPIRGRVRRDPEQGEQAGPLDLGIALTRNQPRDQRVLLLGDGDFLSNAFLGNAGNLDLGLALVRWLSHNDNLIQIPARTAPDQNLELSRGAGLAIGLGFLILLPLGLLLTGVLIWWRRQRL
ncbi:MAG TPA: hypothetical protein ENI96_13220 [Sedimenticola thiotaurini]|uniref:ABC-type uncharacterized transport system domain-containing protein n=1 Tax=Sedimenticola thiotaurini TaxID=1543721 RepID=A0A831RQH3_9GAMM|nr:hypothetical protein [Sedimenticola thiotaurini]